MNTPNDTTDDTTEGPTRTRRPSFWLRAIERRKYTMAHEYRTSLAATAREGISDEDYATTMATLEAMARNLGWSEDDEAEFGPRGRGRGFGPQFGRGFGPGFGRGFGPQFGPGFGPNRGHRGHGRPENPVDSSTENSPEASRSTDPQA